MALKIQASAEQFLTSPEVAALFRVDPKTVNRWADEGRLRVAFRTPGNRRRFALADVRVLMAGRGGNS